MKYAMGLCLVPGCNKKRRKKSGLHCGFHEDKYAREAMESLSKQGLLTPKEQK